MTLDLVSLPKEMHAKLIEASKIVLDSDRPLRVVSHYDADGICAAGVMTNALMRENVQFQTTIIKGLTKEVVETLPNHKDQVILTMDLGSGAIDLLERFESKVVILDHHVPRREEERAHQINPHLHGMDGSYMISGSSLAFCMSLAFSEKNWDLAPISLAGSIGDKQHMIGLAGPNSTIAEVAEEKGIIETRRGLVLEGSTILKAISSSCDPFFVGLSGDEDKTKELLLDADLDPSKELEELGDEDIRRLSSLLVLRLLSRGVLEENAEQLIMDRYWVPGWDLYVRQITNLTNSCGRMGEEGTGVALCLRDGRALNKAKALRKIYKGQILEGLLKLVRDGVYTKDHVQFFYNEKPEFSGSFAGLGMQYILDQERPTLSLAVAGKETKVSARGTRRLIAKGLDLSVTCRGAAAHVGGEGGGHPIASGATIPKGKEDEFLGIVDSMVGTQMGIGEGAKTK